MLELCGPMQRVTTAEMRATPQHRSTHMYSSAFIGLNCAPRLSSLNPAKTTGLSTASSESLQRNKSSSREPSQVITEVNATTTHKIRLLHAAQSTRLCLKKIS